MAKLAGEAALDYGNHLNKMKLSLGGMTWAAEKVVGLTSTGYAMASAYEGWRSTRGSSAKDEQFQAQGDSKAARRNATAV